MGLALPEEARKVYVWCGLLAERGRCETQSGSHDHTLSVAFMSSMERSQVVAEIKVKNQVHCTLDYVGVCSDGCYSASSYDLYEPFP